MNSVPGDRNVMYHGLFVRWACLDLDILLAQMFHQLRILGRIGPNRLLVPSKSR